MRAFKFQLGDLVKISDTPKGSPGLSHLALIVGCHSNTGKYDILFSSLDEERAYEDGIYADASWLDARTSLVQRL